MTDSSITTLSTHDQPTMSSKEIAELTDKLHKNVLRDIRKMYTELEIDYGSNLSQVRIFHLSKELCLVLVSGYNVKLRAKIINRWLELEKAQAPQLPQNFAEALQLAADQAKQLELQAPKVKFAETIEGSEDCVSIGDFAKLNGNFGRNTLFALMRDHKILMKSNVPYQRYIKQEYFEVTEKNTQAGIKTVSLITGKGQLWLTDKINEWIE